MKRAFTLVELLVVVAIIVILLALMVPALDKAIYQAELAVCGANQHATAGGTIAYAAGNRRHYPDRVGPERGWDFHKMSGGGQPEGNRFDDRSVLRSYLQLNGHLRDPLTAKVDLDNRDANTAAYSSYALWFDWRFYDPTQGGKGMYRLGDRFTWTEFGRSSSFNLLVSDWDDIQPSQTYVFSGHPSKDGLMSQLKYDNVPSPWVMDPTATVQGNVSFSWWEQLNEKRGDMDMNFAFDDGSVLRFTDVKWDDARMVRVPDFANRASTTEAPLYDRWLKLPPSTGSQ